MLIEEGADGLCGRYEYGLSDPLEEFYEVLIRYNRELGHAGLCRTSTSSRDGWTEGGSAASSYRCLDFGYEGRHPVL